jgi:UDP-N-acetylglucosamine--N-acetylmuramyl-(pentapeptide) pyrophosphoryl-undecaprenol N-acetylglucosamine transferase
MQHKEGKQKTAIIMAGGTGGHIFPGIALAEELRNKGWKVCWMGAPNSMEERLVIPKGLEFKKVEFGGVRGKGIKTLINLPFKILRALSQSRKIIKEVNPDVVIGFGGYITFPGGLMARLNGKPLILHEQNSIAGLSNKVLSKIASKVFTAYPNVFPKSEWIGNPLRAEFLEQDSPENRFKDREGSLNVVVVGGSLGAKAINDIMPKALALIDENLRPNVIHQSGEKQIEELKKAYDENGVKAELTPFISNTAQAFANADLIIARAGASTVTEIAAIGAAAIFIPFPHAVDDHQTFNAKFLENAGAGLIIQQKELETKWLADILIYLKRDRLLEYANKAYELRKTEAVKCMVESCEKLVK